MKREPIQTARDNAQEVTVIRMAQLSWVLSRVRGGVMTYPFLIVVLGWPVVLFQFLRHKALVSLLSLPKSAVGFGYEYLSRGEIPDGYVEEDIQKA